MNPRISVLGLGVMLVAGSSTRPLLAQVSSNSKVAIAPKNAMELLISCAARPDGVSAEVDLTSTGINGVEIHQLRSEQEPRVIAKAILGPVASSIGSNLSHTRLILEKEAEASQMVLELHPLATPGKSIRLVLLAESVAHSGRVTMGFISSPSPDPGTGAGTGDCYPISFTSDRCGTITACCPTTSCIINGITCVITCN